MLIQVFVNGIHMQLLFVTYKKAARTFGQPHWDFI